MGKIQGDAVKNVDDAAAAAAETHKAPVKPSTSKKEHATLHNEAKGHRGIDQGMLRHAEGWGPRWSRCVHIQLALEKIIAQMTSSLKFMESSSCSWLCVKDYEMELYIPMNALEMVRWDKPAGRCLYENHIAMGGL